jgi:hypothetical protein
VTVQVLALPEVRLDGLHCREDKANGAWDGRMVSEAVCALLPRVAVTTAVWVVVTAPAVAAKVAEVAPAATVTEAGTVSAVLLLESATAVAPVGAG